MKFSRDQKNILLDLVRNAIRMFLETGEYIQLDEGWLNSGCDTKFLTEDKACFITLYQNRKLRGCVGTVQDNDKLYKNIIKYAIFAATEDDRFDSVCLSEIDELEIEISILTPMQELSDIDDFEIGKDGLMIIQGNNSGLLLPQVALEWNFSKQEFLEQLCLKAGLEKKEYTNSSSTIYRFSGDCLKFYK